MDRVPGNYLVWVCNVYMISLLRLSEFTCGMLERLSKLNFVIGFQNKLSIKQMQNSDIETRKI